MPAARVPESAHASRIDAKRGQWQVDNHGVNREALIKAYDVLVKTPEDRKKLERAAPLLVATRDQVVVQLKREKLAAELNQRNLQNHTVRSHERTQDLSREEVHHAYNRVRGRQLGSAVFISDLATELQIGFEKLHEWIRSEVIESGHGSLDEGHWPTATEGQRLLLRSSNPKRSMPQQAWLREQKH